MCSILPKIINYYFIDEVTVAPEEKRMFPRSQKQYLEEKYK